MLEETISLYRQEIVMLLQRYRIIWFKNCFWCLYLFNFHVKVCCGGLSINKEEEICKAMIKYCPKAFACNSAPFKALTLLKYKSHMSYNL